MIYVREILTKAKKITYNLRTIIFSYFIVKILKIKFIKIYNKNLDLR